LRVRSATTDERRSVIVLYFQPIPLPAEWAAEFFMATHCDAHAPLVSLEILELYFDPDYPPEADKAIIPPCRFGLGKGGIAYLLHFRPERLDASLDELGDHRKRRDDEQLVSAASLEAGENVVDRVKGSRVLLNDDILAEKPSQLRDLRRQGSMAR
jgi:hypothetical protein